MPYFRNKYKSSFSYHANYKPFGKAKNKKYTNAEKIAFRLGQEQRVKKSLSSGNSNSRVYDAYCKGYQGIPNNGTKKPLFSN